MHGSPLICLLETLLPGTGGHFASQEDETFGVMLRSLCSSGPPDGVVNLFLVLFCVSPVFELK